MEFEVCCVYSEFGPAVGRDGDWEPSPVKCSDCGGDAFKLVGDDD